jgi:hypothetical protein
MARYRRPPDWCLGAPLVRVLEKFRYYLTQDERVFDAAVLSAGLILLGPAIIILRAARRFAHFPERHLAPWASQLEPKELLKLENDLHASRIQAITTAAQIVGGSVWSSPF